MQHIITNKSITADNMIIGTANVTYNGMTGVIFNKNFELDMGATLIADRAGCN